VALAALVAGCGGGPKSDGRFELAFQRTVGERTSVWVARLDGTHGRLAVRNAVLPNVAPGGKWLAYGVLGGPATAPTYYLRDVGGTTIRVGAGYGGAWAPSGDRFALAGARGLVIVDVRSRTRRVLVRDDVCCSSSFSPDGEAVAFARNYGHGDEPRPSDVYAVRLADGRVMRLTGDRRSSDPVWGQSWIAYRRSRPGPIAELWLMRADGGGKHVLDDGSEPSLHAATGIEPIGFSARGTRLLACLAFEFECRPVVFDVREGHRRVLPVRGRNELATATAIARDGTQVLVEVGRPDDPELVVSLPTAGGAERVLARDAAAPSWSR